MINTINVQLLSTYNVKIVFKTYSFLYYLDHWQYGQYGIVLI